LTPTPIGEWVARHHPETPLLKPDRGNRAEVVGQIRAVQADAWVVIAYGQKLSRELLADRFAINLHASLLPRWRGAAPIAAAILAGDKQTGNTVITLADRMDAGLILGQTVRAIDPLETAGELHDRLAVDGPELVERVLQDHLYGALHAREQIEGDVTIATKLGREDDNFDPRQPADFIRRQVHALTPWPGVSVTFLGPEHTPAGTRQAIAAKLRRVEVIEAPIALPPPLQSGVPIVPGALLDHQRGIVGCGHATAIRILDLQPAGRNPMKWEEFARGAGRNLGVGGTLVSTRELES
jgi:methionyl-tRNA formyltransferase